MKFCTNNFFRKIDGDNISGRISVAMGSNNLRDESQLIRMAVRRVIKYEGFIDQTLASKYLCQGFL